MWCNRVRKVDQTTKKTYLPPVGVPVYLKCYHPTGCNPRDCYSRSMLEAMTNLPLRRKTNCIQKVALGVS
jgi:hypothetical protein